MRMREKPLTPWIIAECGGKILSGHCDCMAGLGETCSHVGSLLWAIEAGVRMRDSLTVTQKKAYWVIPPSVKEVSYSRIKDMNFQGKHSSWKQSRSPSSSVSPSPSPSPSPVPENYTSGFDCFLNSLATCSTKPAILSLISPYSDSYIPKSLAPDLPIALTNLYDPDNLKVGYHHLLQKASEVNITVTESQAMLVERETRSQSCSRLWYRMRSGRITASKFKAACRTDPCLPSHSLVMSICHPELSRFSSAATQWGCEHEQTARDQYSALYKQSHEGFEVTECGFYINTNYPFIGASPDGVVTCKCCGDGICEIKVIYVITT